MRARIVGRLIAHRGGDLLSAANPLGNPDGPVSEPTLGVKVLLGKQQYGAFLDREGLLAAGITVDRNLSIEFDLRLLTEGAVPTPTEVTDA